MCPLKPLVSTVLRTTGTSKTRAAFASTRLLLIIDWRSKLLTPKSICGCKSMMVTTQLSGVRSPFSLRCAPRILFDMTSTYLIPMKHSTHRLFHLGHTAIHEQLDTGNITAVIQNKEDDRLGHLVGRPRAAKRHRRTGVCFHVLDLVLAQAERVRVAGRDDRTRAGDVDANLAVFQ